MCSWFRVVTISPFRLLNRVSVWAVKVDEEQSIVTFLVPPFFPQGFSMFLSLKANWIMYAKWNESDYKIRSLGLKRVGKWTMCPTICIPNPGRWSHILIPFYHLLWQQSQWTFMVSKKCFCLPQQKLLTVTVDYK